MDPVIDHINQALDRLEATSPVKYSYGTRRLPGPDQPLIRVEFRSSCGTSKQLSRP